MKVTQIIKNAIDTRVREIAEPKKQALREQLDKLHNEQKEYLSGVKTEVKDLSVTMFTHALSNITKKHPEITLYWSKYNYSGPNTLLTTPAEIADALIKSISLDFIYYKKDEEDNLTAQINDINEKINKNINDIILELELGGNKSTLDDLLKKVKF